MSAKHVETLMEDGAMEQTTIRCRAVMNLRTIHDVPNYAGQAPGIALLVQPDELLTSPPLDLAVADVRR